jgi:hypothetical protein
MGEYTLCGQCAIFFINIKIRRFFLDSIQLVEKPGGRHICLGYL